MINHLDKSVGRGTNIPKFPGKEKGDNTKPLPPKYLEITYPDGTVRTIENPKRIQEELKRA